MIPHAPNPHDKLTSTEFNQFQRIFIIENLFSNEMCDELVDYGRINATPASNKHDRPHSIKLDHVFLPMDNKYHIYLQDAWNQAIEHFQFKIDFVEPYELKKYPTGGHFARHIDNYHGLNLSVDSKLSMSIQLTDEKEYTAGNLVIGHRVAPKKKGTGIFFPSFYNHHVDAIATGERWSLIGWAWGPYWV